MNAESDRPFIVRARPGVRFDRIQPAGFCLLAGLHEAAQACRIDLLISCGTEAHGPDDPHTLGEALDLSVREMEVHTLLDLKVCLERWYGPLFTVLYEVKELPTDPRLLAICTVNPKATAAHLHLQRKKGTSYPPAVQAA